MRTDDARREAIARHALQRKCPGTRHIGVLLDQKSQVPGVEIADVGRREALLPEALEPAARAKRIKQSR